MSPIRFSKYVLALVMVGTFAGAGSANASTTVGVPVDAWSPSSWSPGTVIAQRRQYDLPGAMYPGFSSGGILTSVTVRTQGDAADIRVSILRAITDPTASSADFFSFGGVTIPVTADPSGQGHRTTVPTRLPVVAGDRFGSTTALAGTRYLDWYSAAEFDYCFYLVGAHADGEAKNYLSTNCNNYIPLVEGELEPDADADGYGDETQDACPTDATTQGACPAAKLANLVLRRVASKAKPRSSSRRSFRITNTGNAAATMVPFSIKSSKKVRELKIVRGCTPGSNKRSCTIPAIAPGASVTITVSLKRKRATRTVLTARSGALKTTTTVKFSKPKK